MHGVADQQAAVREHGDLAGIAQRRARRRRRDVRRAAAAQRAAALVLGDELLEQPGEPRCVTLAGGGVHDVILGIDGARASARRGRRTATRSRAPGVEDGVVLS